MFDPTQFLRFLAASAVVGNAVHAEGAAGVAALTSGAPPKVAAETGNFTWHA